MIEEMKIGVSLVLTGDATAKLKAFGVNVEKITKNVTALEDRLKALSATFNTLNPSLTKLVTLLSSAGTEFKGIDNSIRSSSTAFSGFNRSLSETNAKLASAARNAAALKGELAGLSGGVRGGGHRGFIHARGLHAGPLSLSAMAFGAPGIAAMGAGYLGVKGFEANRDYQRELLQLSLQNLPGGTAQAATNWINTQNNPLVSKVQLATALTDAAVITKDMKAAEAIAPQLAQMRAVNQGTMGDKFNATQQQAAIKAAELLSGSKNPKLLSQALNAMFQIGTGTGGRVMPADFLAMIRTSRGALSGSEQYGYQTDLNELFALESLVQESGGPQTGRQLAQMRNHILAGRMTTASVKDFQSLGLVKPGQAEFNKMGMIKRVKPGGIVGSENPNMFDWISKTYLPALTKAGITNWDDIRKHILIDFTNTDATMVSTIISQLNKIQSNIPINKGAATLNEAQNKLLKTPGGQQMTLSVAWSNFSLAIGKLTSPATTLGLNEITKGLIILTNLINKFSSVPGSTAANGPSFKQMITSPFRLLFADQADKWGNSKSTWMEPATSQTPPATIAKSSAPTPVYLMLTNGRTFAEGLLPELGSMMNRDNFVTPTRFNTGQSPTPVGSTTPF